MKIKFQDNTGVRFQDNVVEVVIFDDDENPISVSIETLEFITSANAADKDFASVLKDSGISPSKTIRL